ncbi:T9SS type A sorting domain-containing protein [Adhaeribacter pallidiroseus]|uniref:Secretion system C-terminal sorting domain-containing protein n=1 Tax=Adhaeribacter pallidiroseus TaxID=2072847 RepID=A0A369QH37_9BACT|nr:T9SS type A sorting domain-containing protein [Adhaeribacter pallidiroseus]RDC64221.1 hypothetical protein AHMF7616_02833 [Adhaeribacter pallidiroseus]
MKTPLSCFYLVLESRIFTPWWRQVGAILLFTLTLPAVTCAQNKIWDKSIGGNFPRIQQTREGGFITAGNVRSASKQGFGLIKLTADGILIWEKSFVGNGTSFFLTALQQTQDDGYILGGYTNAGKSGDKSEASRGQFDYWVVKVKADGSKEWDKTLGGNRDDLLAAIQQTPDGGYIVGGSSTSGISGDKTQENQNGASIGYTQDYWVVKLTANGSKAWDKSFGGDDQDQLATVQLTQDGGYILGGSSNSDISGDKTQDEIGSSNFLDFWLIKLNAQGNKVWDKTIGGTREDILESLQATQDGGFIVGGTSDSDKSGDKSESFKSLVPGIPDYWVVKLTAEGNKVWDNTIGGDRDDFLAGVQQTQDGGYIVGGSSVSRVGEDKTEAPVGNVNSEFPEEFVDYWVVKLTPNGTKVWDKTIGGDQKDELNTILQTQDGNYLLAGTSSSGISGDKTAAETGLWLVKLDNSNTNISQYIAFETIPDKTVASVPFTLSARASSGLPVTFSIVSGPATLQDSTITLTGVGTVTIKAIQAGNAQFKPTEATQTFRVTPVLLAWDRRYGGSGTDNFTSVIKTADGGYLSGGYTNSGVSGDKTQGSQGQNDYWIVKSDKNGQKIWDKRFGGTGNDYLNRLIQTQDGGYLLAGSSFSGKEGDKTEASRGSRDYWIVKTDKNGTKQWDKTFGGTGQDELIKVIQLASGEYILGGYSNSPISGDKSQASRGGRDYWVVKISKTGTKVWDKRYGGAATEELGSFILTADGGLLLGGTSDSNTGGDKKENSRGYSDYWVVKTNARGTLEWSKTFGGDDTEKAYTIGQAQGSNYFIAGWSYSGKSGEKSQDNQGGKDYWLLKFNAAGNKIWDKTFGGNNDDELRASTYTSQGHYLLAGHSLSGVSGDKSQASQGESDYWLVEVDENGNKVQDQRFGGSGTEELRTITQTREGGLLLGGRSNSGVRGDKTQPSQSSTDFWLVKVLPTTSAMAAARTTSFTEEAPATASLSTVVAYPNPFSDRLRVRFSLPKTQPATLRVLDSQGREIKKLFQGEAQADKKYEVEWQAGKQTNGLYLLQLQTPAVRNTQKVLLSK